MLNFETLNIREIKETGNRKNPLPCLRVAGAGSS